MSCSSSVLGCCFFSSICRARSLMSSTAFLPASSNLPMPSCSLPSTSLPVPLSCCSVSPVHSPAWRCTRPATSFILPSILSLFFITVPGKNQRFGRQGTPLVFQSSHHSSASQQLEDERDHCQHYQHVDKSAQRVAADYSNQPQDQK